MVSQVATKLSGLDPGTKVVREQECTPAPLLGSMVGLGVQAVPWYVEMATRNRKEPPAKW